MSGFGRAPVGRTSAEEAWTLLDIAKTALHSDNQTTYRASDPKYSGWEIAVTEIQ